MIPHFARKLIINSRKTHLNRLSQRLVMIDRISVRLDRDLLLHSRLHDSIPFRFVLENHKKLIKTHFNTAKQIK